MDLGLLRNLGQPQPGWEALSAPVMPPPIPCAQQHVNSAQANTQLWFFFAMCRSQLRPGLHIQLLLLLLLLFTATWEGWSNVSSVDGEMGQSQMTGTFHRLWSSRIGVNLIILIFLGLIRAFYHQNMPGEREACRQVRQGTSGV